ncbi:RHS domain-containing protein [Aestuariibacter sp. AA17]|uniref:RHS domain-containing protein n=1 Tax=Fluctibacter corallii TaxID=2984329 RepID=A0ABT3ACG3_9ALTE|nr:RHS repeat-associated core domain-containing protein [Aestuariibacter sp. AA17]MCV2886371.1 RHS domain-containing protein [Aestuariibacter sp. AA17]
MQQRKHFFISGLYALALTLLLSLSSGLLSHSAFAYHYPWDQGHDTTNPNDPDDPGPCEGPDCENDPCNNSSTGSPVYIATGQLVWTEQDILLNGTPALSVSRTYNSRDPRVGAMGSAWSMSCDQALVPVTRFEQQVVNDAVVIVRKEEYVRRLPNGKRYAYSLDDNDEYTAPGLFDKVIPQADGTAKLLMRDGRYYVFAASGQVISEADRNGNLISYSYDTDGRLVSKSDEHGRALQYNYNLNGFISDITDHSGRAWQYAYDASGNLLSVTDPAGGVRYYEYSTYQDVGDAQVYSHLTKVTDEAGVVETQVTYNGSKVYRYKEYENQYTYTYDETNRRTSKVDSVGSRWTYTYNETGQYTRVEEPLNRVTTFERNEDSLPIRLTTPGGLVTTYSYDGYSNLVQRTDSRGTITTEFDGALPWPQKVTSRTGRTVNYSYDERGNMLSMTDEGGKVSQMKWTAQGYIEEHINALGQSTQVVYNNVGLPVSSTDPIGRTTLYEYDARYNLISLTNPAGEKMQYQYDALDRVTQITSADGSVTAYQHDAAGKPLSVTNAAGESVTYLYDTFGRVRERTFYDGGKTLFTYYADNELRTRTDANGVTATYYYDAAKRLTEKRYSDGNNLSFGYNVRDDLTSASNANGSVSREFDEYGRLTRETVNGVAVDYEYNAEDEITSLNALTIKQTYTQSSRGLTDAIALQGVPSGITNNYAFDDMGRMTELQRGGAIADSQMAYSAANQLVSLTHTGVLDPYQYVFDAADRISQWQGVDAGNKTYAYDAKGQVTQVQSSSSAENFAYDALGNRTGNGALYDAGNRLLEYGDYQFSYDGEGNRIEKKALTSGEREVYEYNGLNQLVKYQKFADNAATSPSVDYRYVYGPLGRRWAKINNLNPSNQTAFYWAGSMMVGENIDGTERRYVGDAIAPSMIVENGNVYHYLRDHLGTPQALIDQNNQIVWQAQYSSFGEVAESASGVVNNLRFSGQYHDRESGLYFNNARDYDPSLGRYIQSDQLGLFDGPNTYTYAHNNPLTYTDPTGEFGLIGAGIGAGIDLLSQLASNGGNWNCVSWGQVAISAGLGAIGGGLTNGLAKGAFRLKTVGSNTWSATKHWGRARNIKAMQVTNGQHRHHWLLQRNQGWGKNVSNRIKNQPWNLNSVSPSFNNWMSRGNTNLRSLLGAPPWARGVAGGSALAGGGAAANAAGGGSDCGCP